MNNRFSSLRLHMRTTWITLILIIFLTMLCAGCSRTPTSSSLPQKKEIPISREDLRVEIWHFIDTPFTAESPIAHKWYWWVAGPDLIWSAKHLFTGNLAALVLKNHAWEICPIKQLWLHPEEDIALIKTANICVPEAPLQLLTKHVLPNELIYLDTTLHTSMLMTQPHPLRLMLKNLLIPGMSWSPLFLRDKTLVWVVSAQTNQGTEAIIIDDQLYTSWPILAEIFPNQQP